MSDVVRNGDGIQSYPGCVNLSFAYVEGESLLMALKVCSYQCLRVRIAQFDLIYAQQKLALSDFQIF